ncbi:MAG: hypothetical protein JWL95_2781, partial [Gemmatimonadetes bacterium]|nr:hypothetical protein [Gemmatimonadota bacterium]
MRPADRPTPSPGASGADTMLHRMDPRRISRSLGGTWSALAPLATAVLALAALAAVPWTVRSKLASVRLDMARTVAPARELVRDIAEAATFDPSSRRADRSSGVPVRVPALLHAAAAAADMMRARDSALVRLVPRLGSRAAA